MAIPEKNEAETQVLGAAAAQSGVGFTPDAKPGGSETSVPSASSSVELDRYVLQANVVLSARYEIIQLLGKGGMGAVYKAHDRELNRIVALKTIHPDYCRDAAFLQRFKQEILLASEITHPNVIRMYDIAEDGGMKFVTMEYIEGEHLHSILSSRGKLPPAETVEVIRQVCVALEAAHKRGVIHRDLKPQNIMRDSQGRVVVMDFGLARGFGGDGLTQTGALVGTMAYMSPEQAIGAELDVRSDIFAVGLIFFELLSGTVPYRSESAIGSLVKRTQVAAERVCDIEATVPPVLNTIVAKCLERDKKLRYESVAQLLTDLDRWHSGTAIARPRWHGVHLQRKALYGMAAGVLALSLLGAGIYVKPHWMSTSSDPQKIAAPPLAIAFVPLRNASGDKALDWIGDSVAEMLSTDVGQSASLRNVSSDRLHQMLRDLRITTSSSSMDPDTLRRLASYSNADVLVSGQFAKMGDRIRVDLSVLDLKNDRSIPIKSEAANQNELLVTVDKMAESIRSSLSLPADAQSALRKTSFKPSTTSVEALKQYTEGLEFLRNGKNLEARQAFQAATQKDPQFALAYSKLGLTLSNLGYGDEAERAARASLDLSESLPAPEKYQISAQHARTTKQFSKAVEAYLKLAAVLPADTEVQTALAHLYEDTRETDKAAEQYQKLIAADPKNIDALIGIGRVGILRGDAQSSLQYLNQALTSAVQIDNEEQKATALYLLGTSYGMLNKSGDALNSLAQALEIRRKDSDKGGIAQTLNAMAQVQQSIGKTGEAQKNFEQALQMRRAIGDKRGLANTLLDLGGLYEGQGKFDLALDTTKKSLQIQRELGDPQNEATCLNNIGWIYLDKSDFENATTYFRQALSIREKLGDTASIADTVYNLADAQSRMGQYDAAIGDFLKSLELWRKVNDSRGQGIANFGLGKLFAYQGRFGSSVTSEREALERMRQVNDSGLWLAQVQGELGYSLAMAGNDSEAQQNLSAAIELSTRIKNLALTVRLLNYEGDRLFLKGDFGGAKAQFGKALEMAPSVKDRETLLLTKFNLAKCAIRQSQTLSAVESLKEIASDADRAGMKYLYIDALTYAAEGSLKTAKTEAASEVLDLTLRESERMNLKMLQARSRLLLADVSRKKGDEAAAERQLAQARQLLEQMRAEAQSAGFAKRSDIANAFSVRNDKS